MVPSTQQQQKQQKQQKKEGRRNRNKRSNRKCNSPYRNKPSVFFRQPRTSPTMDALLDPSCPDPDKAKTEIKFVSPQQRTLVKPPKEIKLGLGSTVMMKKKTSKETTDSITQYNHSSSKKEKATKQRSTTTSSSSSTTSCSSNKIESEKQQESRTHLDIELQVTKLQLEQVIRKQQETETALKETKLSLEVAKNRIEGLLQTVEELEMEKISNQYNCVTQEAKEAYSKTRQDLQEAERQIHEILKSKQQHKEQQETLAKVVNEQRRELQRIHYLETELQSKSKQIEALQSYIKKAEQQRMQVLKEADRLNMRDKDNNEEDDDNDICSQERDVMILDMVAHLEDLQIQMNDMRISHREYTSLNEIWRENSSEYIDNNCRAKWILAETKKRQKIDEMGFEINELGEEIATLSMKSKDLYRTHHQLEFEKAERMKHNQEQYLQKNTHQSMGIVAASLAPPSFAMKSVADISEFEPRESGILSNNAPSSLPAFQDKVIASAPQSAEKSFRSRDDISRIVKSGSIQRVSFGPGVFKLGTPGSGGRKSSSPLLPFTFAAEESSPMALSSLSGSVGTIDSVRNRLISFRGSRQKQERNIKSNPDGNKQASLADDSLASKTSAVTTTKSSAPSSLGCGVNDEDFERIWQSGISDEMSGESSCQEQKSLRKTLHRELFRESMASFRGNLLSECVSDSTQKPWMRDVWRHQLTRPQTRPTIDSADDRCDVDMHCLAKGNSRYLLI